LGLPRVINNVFERFKVRTALSVGVRRVQSKSGGSVHATFNSVEKNAFPQEIQRNRVLVSFHKVAERCHTHKLLLGHHLLLLN